MKKVIIWGTGNTYRINLPALKRQEESKNIEIVALVNRAQETERDGYRVINADEIKDYEYDLVIVCAEGEMAADIYNDIKKLGIGSSFISHIEYFLLSADADTAQDHDNVVKRQLLVIETILKASDEEISNEKWMLDRILEYGVYPFELLSGRETLVDAKSANEGWGVLQIPEELAKFLVFLSTLEISTVAEVGVFKGRSSYLMCAVLSRKGALKEYLCIDIIDNLDEYEQFANLLPALKKAIPNTTDDFVGESYDMVFIDANHSYDGSILDYNNLGIYANTITAFHDVYGHEYDHENGGTVRTWLEVLEDTPNCDHKVFSKYPDQWMGIGCVIW